MVALRKPDPPSLTVEEFLTWDADDATGRRWQLVEGEPVLMAPARQRHGAIQGEIARLIGNHLNDSSLPCRLIVAPGIQPRVRSERNFRVPDLGVTCAPPDDGVMTADPVLLIEILSPGNERLTRSNIWTYTTIPSVREILVVNSQRMEVELLRRESSGGWPASATILQPPVSLELTSIGLVVPVSSLYRTAGLPDVTPA
jgi:Uma2 family endonuclease